MTKDEHVCPDCGNRFRAADERMCPKCHEREHKLNPFRHLPLRGEKHGHM